MNRAALRLLPVLLGAVLAATACDEDAGEIGRYVAMGDSFSSGAGLPEQVPAGGACQQSRLSYPNLLAEEIGADLEDVTCGGATTENGAAEQPLPGQSPWPPQLDGLSGDTDLVTVGLGGNDLDWYLEVMFICTEVAPGNPGGNPCERRDAAAGSPVEGLPQQIGERLEALLEEVRRRAPDARVLVVGYPQPVPASGTCPELPLAEGDYPWVRAQWEAMADAMRQAAAGAGATFVDVLGPSEGHDICAGEEAWVNGSEPVPGVGLSYHPLARGQAAVAELVEDALRR